MLKFYLIEKILYWYWFHEKIQNYTIIYILFITETSPTTWKHGHTSTASIKQTWYSVSRYPPWVGHKWGNVKNNATTTFIFFREIKLRKCFFQFNFPKEIRKHWNILLHTFFILRFECRHVVLHQHFFEKSGLGKIFVKINLPSRHAIFWYLENITEDASYYYVYKLFSEMICLS